MARARKVGSSMQWENSGSRVNDDRTMVREILSTLSPDVVDMTYEYFYFSNIDKSSRTFAQGPAFLENIPRCVITPLPTLW